MPATDHLTSLAPPWVHLVVLKPGERAESAVGSPHGFVTTVVDGRRARSKAALIEEVTRAFRCPQGTGRNWDALEECLADLEWLPAAGYVLVIDNADELLAESPDDYRTFIELLKDVAGEWAAPRNGQWARPAAPFHVDLAVTDGREAARTDWRVPRLAREGG
jgi:hypothetical protein